MSELDRASVQRQLDAKLKIGGLAAFDLFIGIGQAMLMNIFFSETILFIPMVLCFPALIVLFLHHGKGKKPDGYPIHWLKFHTSEGIYLASLKEEYEHKYYRRADEELK